MKLHTFCAKHNSSTTTGLKWVSLTLLDVRWWVHQAWQGRAEHGRVAHRELHRTEGPVADSTKFILM